jgi:hypothetical protein
MWNALKVGFTVMLLAMIALTVVATLDRGVFQAGGELWPDPWFRATLADAYFAFLTVWAWVAYRERSWGTRLLWLVAFLALGSMAIAAYVLIRLARAGPEPSGRAVLLRGP